MHTQPYLPLHQPVEYDIHVELTAGSDQFWSYCETTTELSGEII